jgi:hypothetical protein
MFANRTNTERFPVPAGAGTFLVGRTALTPLAAFWQGSGAGGQAAYGGAQGSEWLGKVGLCDGFVADVESVEDGLVDEAADAVVAAAV